MNFHRLFGLLISACFIVSCGGGGGGSEKTSTTSSSVSTQKMSHNAGKNCLTCHVAGGEGAAKGIFTVAGTLYKGNGAAQTQGTVKLMVHNTNTLAMTLTTDGSGNFYTTSVVDALVPNDKKIVEGVDVMVVGPTGGVRTMPGVVSSGGCNGCHGVSNGKIVID